MYSKKPSRIMRKVHKMKEIKRTVSNMSRNDVKSKLAFLPSLVYIFVAHKTGYEDFYSRIDKHVILGALPSHSILEEIVQKENVSGVISVVQNWELKLYNEDWDKWESRGLSHLHLSTVEFEAPSMEDIQRGLDFIDAISSSNRSTYIHCKAGRSRSATLTACYLAKNFNMSPDEAIAYITLKRKQIKINKVERARIEECYSKYGNIDGTTAKPEQIFDDI